METLPNGFAVFASMSSIEARVLRRISEPRTVDPCKPPITLTESAQRLDDAQRLAAQSNNMNAREQAITEGFSSGEIARTLPTAVVPRSSNDD